MSFGAGLATGMGAGMGAGMGSGIAIGTSAGKQQARRQFEKNLRQFADRHEITIRDRHGRQVSFNEFLEETLRTDGQQNTCSKKPALTIFLLFGLVGALGMGAFLFFVH